MADAFSGIAGGALLNLISDESKKKACQKCGSCCMTVGIWYTNFTLDSARWGILHGGTIIYAEDSKMWGIEYPVKCTALENNQCSIFNDRPNICKSRGIVPDDLRGCIGVKRFNGLEEVEIWLGQ